VISKYDPVLQEHLRRMNESEIRDHNLSHEFKNEQIELMAQKVMEKVLSKTVFYVIVGFP
jgi:ribosomal protein L29